MALKLEIAHSNGCRNVCNGDPTKCQAYARGYTLLHSVSDDPFNAEKIYALLDEKRRDKSYNILFEDGEMTVASITLDDSGERLCRIRVEIESETPNAQSLYRMAEQTILESFED